jgi:hypothetical protein
VRSRNLQGVLHGGIDRRDHIVRPGDPARKVVESKAEVGKDIDDFESSKPPMESANGALVNLKRLPCPYVSRLLLVAAAARM